MRKIDDAFIIELTVDEANDLTEILTQYYYDYIDIDPKIQLDKIKQERAKAAVKMRNELGQMLGVFYKD